MIKWIGETLQSLGKWAAGDPLDERYYSSSILGYGRQTYAGEDVSETSAMGYAAAYAATVLLSGASSVLPLNIHRKSGRRNEIIDDHPAQVLMRYSPNNHSTPAAFRMRAMSEQINWDGGFFAEIERNGLGEPVALWPVHPIRVKYEVEDTRVVYEVHNENGQPTPISAENMFHVPGRYCYDGVGSVGVIRFARESIGLGLATERHGASTFRNGVRPQVALKLGGDSLKNLDVESRNNIRADFESMHAGGSNAGRIPILDRNMELQSFSFSPEDSQFLQTREHNVNEVARWYGVPPHMIQDLRRATFTNIEHQGIEFVKYSLMPWLTLWEAEINRKLLSDADRRQGYYAKHNVNALMRGDMASRASFYGQLWQYGAFSSNDIREKEDMNPVPGGDRYFVPLNMADMETGEALGQDMEAEPEPTPPEEPTQDDPPSQENNNANDSLRRAARVALTSALHHVTDIEIRSACKAAKDSKKFDNWLAGFYGGHADTCERHLWPAMELAREAGGAIHDNHIPHRIASHKQALESLMEQHAPAEFESAVKSTVYGWRDAIESEVADVFG